MSLKQSGKEQLDKQQPIKLCLLATPEVSASSLYGLYDTLSCAGHSWETIVTGETPDPVFDIKIIGYNSNPFKSGNGVVVTPDCTLNEVVDTDLIVVPGMGLSAKKPPEQLEQASRLWLGQQHALGKQVVSACSGAVYLAANGILDGVEATTHWCYKELFRSYYPDVNLRLDRNVCIDNGEGGIVTSGGTNAWQELALYLIARFGGAAEAKRTAKFWLMADLGYNQAPYMSMTVNVKRDDASIELAQTWLMNNYPSANPVSSMVEQSKLSESTFSRRFRKLNGISPMDYVQAVRVEEAKLRLEETDVTIDQISLEVGYEDSASFRRLFKRKTSMTPAEYRKTFGSKRFVRYT